MVGQCQVNSHVSCQAKMAQLAVKSGHFRRIFRFRPAGCRENSNSNEHDYSNSDPHRRSSNEIGSDRQANDQNDEADQIRAE